jgi:hypothetical protein
VKFAFIFVERASSVGDAQSERPNDDGDFSGPPGQPRNLRQPLACTQSFGPRVMPSAATAWLG